MNQIGGHSTAATSASASALPPHFRKPNFAERERERWRESPLTRTSRVIAFLLLSSNRRDSLLTRSERELPPLLSVAVEGLQLRRKFIIKGVKTFNMFNFPPIFLPAPSATPRPLPLCVFSSFNEPRSASPQIC